MTWSLRESFELRGFRWSQKSNLWFCLMSVELQSWFLADSGSCCRRLFGLLCIHFGGSIYWRCSSWWSKILHHGTFANSWFTSKLSIKLCNFHSDPSSLIECQLLGQTGVFQWSSLSRSHFERIWGGLGWTWNISGRLSSGRLFQ